MLFSQRWRALGEWVDRQPWWRQFLLFPPLAPAVLLTLAVCVCPVAFGVAVTVLIATYTALIRAGLLDVDWGRVASGLASCYAMFAAVSYLELCMDGVKRLFGRWEETRRRTTPLEDE